MPIKSNLTMMIKKKLKLITIRDKLKTYLGSIKRSHQLAHNKRTDFILLQKLIYKKPLMKSLKVTNISVISEKSLYQRQVRTQTG